MADMTKIDELAEREIRAREQADDSNDVSARIAHLARADVYAQERIYLTKS